MTVILRAAGIIGIFCVFASGQLASAAFEPTLITSDYYAPYAPAEAESTSISSEVADAPPGDLIPANQPLNYDQDCGLGCSYFGYCPTWDVIVGGIFLHRSRPDPTRIITPPTGTPGVVVSGSDFRFGWDAGPDIIVRRRAASGIIWEGRYFNDRSADANFNVPAITTFRTAGIGVTILGGGLLANSYRTTLDSTELNALAPISSRFNIIGGFRAVYVRDTLGTKLGGTNLNIVHWDDSNQLFGAQTGVSANFSQPTDRLQFYGWLKAGLYGNSADNTFTSQVVSADRTSATQAAFVGDANFAAAYWITPRIAFRGGYQILWLDRLALASEAAPHTVQVAGGTSSPTVTSGNLLYHGATASMQFIW